MSNQGSSACRSIDRPRDDHFLTASGRHAPRREPADTRPARDRTRPGPRPVRSHGSMATSTPSSGQLRPGTTGRFACSRESARRQLRQRWDSCGRPGKREARPSSTAQACTRIPRLRRRRRPRSAFLSTALPLTISSTGTCRVSFTRARSMCQYGCSPQSSPRSRVAMRLCFDGSRQKPGRLALDLERFARS